MDNILFNILAKVVGDGSAGPGFLNILPFLLSFLIALIIPYFIGSLNFAIIISKLLYKEDIRTYGSGNGGMTNMLRTYGKTAAALTLLGDVLKAVISVVIGRVIFGMVGGYAAGLGCMLGHVYPCYYNFKGGKGVLVAAATILTMNPVLFVILLIIFVAMVALTKYISVGSITAAFFYPIFLDKLGTGSSVYLFDKIAVLISVITAILIIFWHRSNIKRLSTGTESKLSFKKTEKKKKDDN